MRTMAISAGENLHTKLFQDTAYVRKGQSFLPDNLLLRQGGE